MKRTLLFMLLIALVLPVGWAMRSAYAQWSGTNSSRALAVSGTWTGHPYDLLYTVAFSSAQQPDGPLVVYRASEANLGHAVPVIALARGSQPQTPVFFPSNDGRNLALLTPATGGYGAALHGAQITVFSSDGKTQTLVVPGGAAADDQVIWSANNQFLYYHTGQQSKIAASSAIRAITGRRTAQTATTGQPADYDEIHRVDLSGHDVTIFHQNMGAASLRLIGLDGTGALIMAIARPHAAVQLVRIAANGGALHGGIRSQGATDVVATLPSDILPGNILRTGSDGKSVVCERVLQWSPLRYTLVQIPFNGTGGLKPQVDPVQPLFATARYGSNISPLNRSVDGRVMVMSRILSTRRDLAAQGISGVPAQESLLLSDAANGATQNLTLPPGGQVVQTFWTAAIPSTQLHVVPQTTLAELLAFHKRLSGDAGNNASVFQQDEWMLEGHAGLLTDAPTPPTMCYGNCPNGATGPAHVSAAILHGVAYTESNWHQFNTSNYDVNNEAIGTPVESFDGGWGEFQQTWAMPPQCVSQNNCRSDASRIQQEQSYNIGTGIQSLISSWNATAGVASSNDPNDPYKANDWFFAVWAYNGSYGNNPNDIPSSNYAHWYPGAPFRSIYEEYVWYYAAHPQYNSNGFTDNYLPSLGPSLLPPQSDFTNTSDSFVYCVTCTIPDWTSGTYDRDWVGMNAPNSTIAGYFTNTFNQLGGENAMGLPRDNGGGAGVHRWGNGNVQDFGGGTLLPGTLMLADGSSTPYLVYGGVWTQYVLIDSGTLGCHGYPTSSLQPYSDPGLGSDTYYQQTFQNGSIIWDATTKTVAVDGCM